MTDSPHELLPVLRRLHDAVRDRVLAACEASSTESLAGIDRDGTGDTIYRVDRVGEEALVEFFEQEVAATTPLVLIAEGLEGGAITLPRGTREADAVWRIIVDPIDGTRGLMYQKRSAWILTGVAPDRGPATSLADIVLALQTEIPLVKQHLHDTLWAVRGEGAHGERRCRLSGKVRPFTPSPSRASSIEHGFATVVRFFPGARDELAAIDEEIVEGALGPVRPGKASCFEDQYIASGGQLYELMAGHDRLVADLRPLLETLLVRRGKRLGICCHPYDVATELIARELGVVVTGARGEPLSAPLDVSTDVAWVGYANDAIRRQIEPLLQAALARRGLAG